MVHLPLTSIRTYRYEQHPHCSLQTTGNLGNCDGVRQALDQNASEALSAFSGATHLVQHYLDVAGC